MEQKFTNIYDKGKWGKRDGKGTSGSGSSISPDTKWYINLLTDVIKTNQIKSVCDIGCGDWNFSKTIDWASLGVNYTGIDCVKSVIDENQKLYSSESVKFIHGDATDIPEGYDLVILKDVIQHWEDKDVIDSLPKIIANNKFVFLGNGYIFGRDKTKNNWTERVLDKTYHYHPIDINKKPLKDLLDYRLCRLEHRRYKQFILLSGVESNL